MSTGSSIGDTTKRMRHASSDVALMRSPSSTALVGEVLGRVRLERIIGEGAMGVVYRGHHVTLGLDVAVKVLKQDGAPTRDRRWRERFEREARLAARIEHPGIVRVIDCGEHDGLPFLVMDLVEGFSLETYLAKRSGALAEPTVLKIILAVAQALGAAHQAGVIHRDLKPANILISRKGQLKVADLGLAREEGLPSLTQERVALGSPAYMAPESLTPGATVDHRCDLYALGVVGYQLAFGRQPFRGSLPEIINGHLAGAIDFGLPTVCGKPTLRLIERMLARSPADRIQTANEVAIQARRVLEGPGRKVAPRTEPGTGSSSAQHSGSDFAGLGRFLESRLGQHRSEHQGGVVIHTTGRERIVVWILLLLAVGAAITGWVMFG